MLPGGKFGGPRDDGNVDPSEGLCVPMLRWHFQCLLEFLRDCAWISKKQK